MNELSVGIVGATGVVGETFCTLLRDSKYSFRETRFFASVKSAGKKIKFRDHECEVQVLNENCFQGLDLVFFSSGDSISKEWVPRAVNQGAIAIDNSAAYRMDPQVPLIVPEVNFQQISEPTKPRVIANPNCSTIQLVVVLNALKEWGPKELRLASYQSVSGAGKEGIQDLLDQSRDVLEGREPAPGSHFQFPIAFECQPKIGSYNDQLFCSEEIKIMNETKKILSMPKLKISAFTVRVPTINGHGEALWIQFDKSPGLQAMESALRQDPQICYLKQEGDKSFHSYGEAKGHSRVFVSRLRQDLDFGDYMMWIVADNLYRGAASNGFLIAERIFDKLC